MIRKILGTTCAAALLCVPAAAEWDIIAYEKARARRAAVELGSLTNDFLNISWDSQALRLEQLETSLRRIEAALANLDRQALTTTERAAVEQVRGQIKTIGGSLSSLLAGVAANRKYIRHPEYRSRLNSLVAEVYSAHRDVVAALETASARTASPRKGA